MPNIIFIEPDVVRKSVNAEIGKSIMEVAVHNGVNGIDADCGGACSCAACHGYIDEKWRDRIENADAVELEMLDFAYMRAEGSRLTCQIKVVDDMDGLLIRLPDAQA